MRVDFNLYDTESLVEESDEDLTWRELGDRVKINIEDWNEPKSTIILNILGDRIGGDIMFKPTREQWSLLLRLACFNLHGQV